MIGSSENTIKEITKKITVEQIINRKTRRLQPNQKDFKQNNSSHMTFIWHGFLTSEQIQGLTKNKISVSKKLTKKNFKIYFEKTINQIILF